MPDLFEPLKHPDDGPTGPALPATEVRRRGDRLRRRRTAVRALGAACAVAVIITGGIALGGNMTGSAPQPPAATQSAAPSPSRTRSAEQRPVVTGIPEGFPLADGYPAATGSDQELDGPGPDVNVLADVLVCDQVPHPTVRSEQRLGVTFTQPEDYRFRELTTYPDEVTASEALTRFVEAYRACPRESFGGTPASVTRTEVRQTGLGDDGYTVLRTYESGGMPALGLSQTQAVRVGNALLLSGTSSEASPDDTSVDAAVRAEETTLRPVVAAMCVFSASGCGTPGA